MKKLFLSLLVFSCISFAAVAQTETDNTTEVVNKRGVALLPKAGDFALGVDATPFLEYMGNFFGKQNDNWAPSFGNNFVIYGKYFLENDRAIRARLNLDLGSTTYKNMVPDDVSTDPDATKDDVMKSSSTDITLGIGYEFRRGRGRLQGFYGGEFALGFSSSKEKYEYGNAFSSTNSNPTTTTDFYDGDYSSQSGRYTEYKYGTTFGVGVNGFVGVEYFFAPQISIGAEVSVGLGYRANGKGKASYEYWDGTKVVSDSDEFYNTPKSSFGLFTNTRGGIFLMFHF